MIKLRLPLEMQLLNYIFHHVLSDTYSDVLYSEECQTKKLSVVCCEMFSYFKAILKLFCCTILYVKSWKN